MRGSTTSSEKKDEPDRRERRRLAMLNAARELFVERGYDAVSLSEIVKRSGGSLATLYELFENKAGLLGAIVANKRFGTHEQIDALIARGGVPAEMLKGVAEILIENFSEPETVGMIRVVMGETLRDPGFAEAIFKASHVPSVERIAELFADWNASGRAVIPDPMLAVHLFFGLTVHRAQNRAIFGELADATQPPPERLVAEATALFTSFYKIEGAETT
ncbi:transcriptional regulator, TetR family [Sphingomonas laterariae]|uniref:Transcriptional regulator, TetR family n=1 Tax=Edaphosphingomonas laterariae TaxID=861865 RepID=A0A239FMT5_9SPHN|nr:TetR/AcrR family transcriptional regulator [Sphingomonas laterariae]SNS58185.1 transcriptional regulator, TetR family [Sphingomonas laterariae]